MMNLARATAEQLAPVRAEILAAELLVDEVMATSLDAMSETPCCTREAQRRDLERSAAELRAALQISAAKIDTITALLRLRDGRRKR